ncbi:MAG: DUF177 domain-containing protein [Calditrichaeota bacterium]|nr:MAG: DUF177 domain-containing protein [Calditrichota bacterium]
MKIPVLHLEDGLHHFEGLLKGRSLQFYRQELYPRDISVGVDVDKYENTLRCSIQVDTIARYTCDRCLNEFDHTVHTVFQLLFHVGKDTWKTSEEEVIHLPVETVDVDLTPWIVESLILDVPMKMLCKEECLGICPQCGVNRNEEPCQCDTTRIDPRWEKLRDLLK